MDAVEMLWSDYELKVGYLCDHLSRMWTRFNFFLSINSALLAVSLGEGAARYAGYLSVAGIALAVLWYRFAATDNYLVEVYRRQVAHVFEILRPAREAAFRAADIPRPPAEYAQVGYIGDEGFDAASGEIKAIEQNMWQKRWPKVSVTELGVVFSFLFGVLWIGRLIIWTITPAS